MTSLQIDEFQAYYEGQQICGGDGYIHIHKNQKHVREKERIQQGTVEDYYPSQSHCINTREVSVVGLGVRLTG